MSQLFGTLETSKLDRTDVVDPAEAKEAGKAADAKKTKEELDRILGVASGALALAESKADKLSGRQLEAVNSGIDAGKVAKIAQNESAISAEVSRATTEEARLQALINAIKTFDAVVADSLPSPSEQYIKKLYLIPSTNPETRNVKDEFICVKIADVWKWEQVGSTAITIEFDDKPTEGSQKAARSGGIWSWVKSLLPSWLTSDYAEPATVESVAKKADKTTPYADGNLAALTADGNLSDSGKKASDFAPAVEGGYLPLNVGGTVNGDTTFIGSLYAGPLGDILGVTHDAGHLYKHDSVKWYYGGWGNEDSSEIAVKGDISALASSKADRPALPVTNGHLASLTADGNLADSGKKASDFAPAVDGGYLPLSGGTMTGDVTFEANGITLGSGGWIFGGGIATAGAGYQKHNLYHHWYYNRDDSSTEDPKFEIAVKGDISATNPTFSNAVIAVGLNIDTNSVAVLNEIAATFGGFPIEGTATTVGGLLAALAAAAAWLKKNKVGSFDSVGGATATVENGVAKLDDFFTESNSLLTGTIDEEIIEKGTAPDAHLEAPTDEHLKLILADGSVAYDSAKALPYKLKPAIGDRVIATMTLTAASTDITLPTISADDTTAKDFILDVTNAYAVEGVATDAVINIPSTDFKLVTRDGESLTYVTTVKAGKSAFICFTQKSPVVVDGTTYPCWCVIQLPFGDPS